MIRYLNQRFSITGTLGMMILCFFQIAAISQISLPGKPYPLIYDDAPDIMIREIVISEAQRSMTLGNEKESMLKIARSGVLLEVDFSPENTGIWDTLLDGSRIWRAGFRVENAVHMGLIFSPYQLKSGVKVFLYSAMQENTLGAFTDINNKSIDLLATAHVPGELLYVEMQVPAYVESYGRLGISGIGCDFSEFNSLKTKKDGWFGESGQCNPDILCTDDAMVRKLRNSVVRIVFQGHQRCTGTLINTTQGDGINYILTAGHCFTKEADANTALFYFGYESPWCEGVDGNSLKSLSGATIRARSNNVDFALLELFEPIPFTYHPYYAGWDYSGQIQESGIVIHHPLGDVKKLGNEEHSPVISSFGIFYDDNKHWMVRHWETGTTEPGSSGAPFFDPSGRVIGTLTGGLATCESPEKDYFQMFSHSWKDYSDQDKQLATWLDPLDLKKTFVNGYDPHEDFWLNGDTLSNISKEEQLISEQGMLEWGSYSGHNSSEIREFAEKFVMGSPKRIQGLIINIDKNHVSRNLRSMNFKVWSGSGLPENVIYEKIVPLPSLIADTLNFIEFDSIIQANSEFYAGYELNYNTPLDTFSAYMAYNRYTGGISTAFVNNGIEWNSLSEFTNGTVNSSFAVFPVVYESLPIIKEPEFEENAIAYPNPASSIIRIQLREMSDEAVRISMYNVQGQLIFEDKYKPFQHIIPLPLNGISNGIYLIKVKQGNRTADLKVAVIK